MSPGIYSPPPFYHHRTSPYSRWQRLSKMQSFWTLKHWICCPWLNEQSPEVKINNNLQAVVCLRVGWLNLKGHSLWECPQAHSQSYLVAAGAGNKDLTSHAFEVIQLTFNAFFVYTMAGQLPIYLICAQVYAHSILHSFCFELCKLWNKLFFSFVLSKLPLLTEKCTPFKVKASGYFKHSVCEC